MKQFYQSDLKELAGKYYASKEECEAAEAKVSDEAAKKQKAASEKKADANIVEEAIIARDEAFEANKKKKEEARKEYVKAVEEARKKYDAICDEVEKDNNKKNDAVVKDVKAFCEKYKQPYHSTITYKDGSTRTYKYAYDNNSYSQLPSLLDSLSSLFWF